MRQLSKSSMAATGQSSGGGPGWFETPWHYVSVAYGAREMGLLVETDDEEEAWREAEDLCDSLGTQARIIAVQKVVVQ